MRIMVLSIVFWQAVTSSFVCSFQNWKYDQALKHCDRYYQQRIPPTIFRYIQIKFNKPIHNSSTLDAHSCHPLVCAMIDNYVAQGLKFAHVCDEIVVLIHPTITHPGHQEHCVLNHAQRMALLLSQGDSAELSALF